MAAPSDDRRARDRGPLHLWGDAIYRGLRALLVVAHNFYAAVGIFLIAGALVAIGGTWGFARVAALMREGTTQRFDDAVLRWIAGHQISWLEQTMLELTMLGNGAPIGATVAIAALFLWLTRHRYSALLLIVATAGGLVLNTILKTAYERPRPGVFPWGQEVVTYSFPSGHAMSAAVVYGTVAYLAARLQKRQLHRVLTLAAAGLIIALISISRMYLGVHYPSDVLAGVTIGLAWAAFCMATLEALQVVARRSTPAVRREVREHEVPVQRESG